MILILLLLTSARADDFFRVFWNVPRGEYAKDETFLKDVEKFKIEVNDKFKFRGDKIVMYYEADLGLYPHASTRPEHKNVSGKMVNGGIPQKVVLSEHLGNASETIDKTIPDKNFAGIGIIDWESWRPVWNTNWGSLEIYQNESKDLAKEVYKNKKLTDDQLEKYAKRDFEKAGKSMMLRTLKLAKRMRKNARWGFYLFPDCYGADKAINEGKCSEGTTAANKQLDWLYSEATALFPSIYVHKEKESTKTTVQADILNAVSVNKKKVPIYVYFKMTYKDDSYLSKKDLCNTIQQTAALGADGIVIWAGSKWTTGDGSETIPGFVHGDLGPQIRSARKRQEECAKSRCSGHGLCIHERAPARAGSNTCKDAWAKFKECRCFEGFTGEKCADKE